MFSFNIKLFMCFASVVQNRTPGEAFVAKPAKEAEMEKIMKSMEVITLSFHTAFCTNSYLRLNLGLNSALLFFQGMPGAPGMKMYSRDDLMNMKNFGDEDADDDDEEDEETSFPSKLVIRNFQSLNNCHVKHVC